MTREPLGWFDGKVHVFPVRVYYEDTDAAGIVYYANYLKFVERARTEMMRHVGLSHSTLRDELDAGFIVRRCRIDYRQAARIDDRLEVRTRLVKLAGASMDAEQIVVRDERELVRVDLTIACVSSAGRPLRLPDAVKGALAPFVDPTTPFAKG